jgi:transcription initiation factor TFIIIB Brf1 subunit/transcription initiation factor TFIIB
MTPYFNSTSYDNVDIEEANCRSCQTPTLYLDNSQGDTVCTSCGLVQAQHYKSSIAEWRDYSAIDPDSSGRNITARAGSLVDESRWAGGLEPTALGKVYNPSGSASYNNPRLDGYRRKLGKMKRVVDRWVEKEFERQVEEGKIALKVKAKKEKQSRANNGHDNENTSGSDSGIKEEEDWTGYGTNEHEEIARQRMEEISKVNKLLVSEKWSLDRALLLHGESHEIPTYYTTYNAMAGEQPKDIQKERHILNKRMDAAQRKASADLYCHTNSFRKR